MENRVFEISLSKLGFLSSVAQAAGILKSLALVKRELQKFLRYRDLAAFQSLSGGQIAKIDAWLRDRKVATPGAKPILKRIRQNLMLLNQSKTIGTAKER